MQLIFDFVTLSSRALWQYAYAGLGYLSCGTSFVHTYQLPDLVLLPMANQIFNFCGIGTVTRQGKYLSSAAVALLEHLKKQVHAYAILHMASDSITLCLLISVVAYALILHLLCNHLVLWF